MGIYINPTNDTTSRSKLDTILALGMRISEHEFLSNEPGIDAGYGVALIDNGFIAAGVAYNRIEAREFAKRAMPIAYVWLTLDQIRQLDPGTADSLAKYYPGKHTKVA